jgi:hypothetical protein
MIAPRACRYFASPLRYILRFLSPQHPHSHCGHTAFQLGRRLVHGLHHLQEGGYQPFFSSALLNTLAMAPSAGPVPLLPWLCRSCLMPLLDPSHLRDDRQAQSCRPQPVLPWAQWPTAFSCPSSPYFLPSVCAYHTTVVLLLPNVNTGLVSAQSRRTNVLANCLFLQGQLIPSFLEQTG